MLNVFDIFHMLYAFDWFHSCNKWACLAHKPNSLAVQIIQNAFHEPTEVASVPTVNDFAIEIRHSTPIPHVN